MKWKSLEKLANNFLHLQKIKHCCLCFCRDPLYSSELCVHIVAFMISNTRTFFQTLASNPHMHLYFVHILKIFRHDLLKIFSLIHTTQATEDSYSYLLWMHRTVISLVFHLHIFFGYRMLSDGKANLKTKISCTHQHIIVTEENVFFLFSFFFYLSIA